MDQITILNIFHCHRVAHDITNEIYTNTRVLIGLGSMFQKRHLENKTKKLDDNNRRDNNADKAQTKIKPPPSKK